MANSMWGQLSTGSWRESWVGRMQVEVVARGFPFSHPCHHRLPHPLLLPSNGPELSVAVVAVVVLEECGNGKALATTTTALCLPLTCLVSTRLPARLSLWWEAFSCCHCYIFCPPSCSLAHPSTWLSF